MTEEEEGARIVKVERAPEGHAVTHIEGEKHPILGFPHGGLLRALDPAKKLAKFFIEHLHRGYKKALPDPDTLVPQVKEIYRVLTIVAERWVDPKQRELTEKVRDIVCAFLERDMVYRGVLTYAATQVDIEKLKPLPLDVEFFRTREDFNYDVNKKKFGEQNGG